MFGPKVRMLVVMLLVLCVAASCATSESSLLKGQVSVEPFDWLSEEGQRYSPFIGNMNGAVKYSYRGEHKKIKLTVSRWEQGRQVVGEMFSTSFDIREEDTSKLYNGEVMLSIETRVDDTEQTTASLKLAHYDENGNGGTSGLEFELDPSLTLSGTIQLHGKQIFTDEKPIRIWGMQSSSSGMMRSTDLTDEALSRTEYAIILAISFEPM